MNDTTKGFALVTGASSGIGAVYADRLARRGHDLILVARRQDRLDGLAGRIRAETGRQVETLAADLNDRAALARIEQALRSDPRISLLVNNAGVASVKPLLASDADEMSAMIHLNCAVLMRLSYAAAPAFVARGQGTIINIASAVAIGPERLNGVYGATKAFVLAFSQTLRHELAAKGVRVQAVLPGATATDIWANAGVSVDAMPQGVVMQTDVLVDAALKGLDLGEFFTAPSLPDIAEWDAYEAARLALASKLSRSEPAPRYKA